MKVKEKIKSGKTYYAVVCNSTRSSRLYLMTNS